MADQHRDAQWIVVIPFKGAPHGKSRLGSAAVREQLAHAETSGFTISQRERLALAFLRDTVAAVGRIGSVAQILIVSNADGLRGRALNDIASADLAVRESSRTDPTVTVISDPGGGLNAAATTGIEAARALDPSAWVAVMTGDLACLRAGDFDEALTKALPHLLGLVPDHEGNGSTMITIAPGVAAQPRFGAASRSAHEAVGYRIIELPIESSVRFDIDTAADLQHASSSGRELGPESSTCLLSFEGQ